VKLNTSTHKATGTGFKEVAKFKMDMNAKAARVLSDTLYKDKIGSIIREISCNAFDAHIEAGCPEKPFKVKLPDAFDPTFSVRDFGPGLSHEDVEGIYTTYFGSTKDQANDAVGAFGLGSKTPFSYTDSFMVTSIHKGVKRVYNAYLEEGLPQISMFGEGEETDEPNGLEVTVTIDPKDFHEFKNSLVKQLRFFPVKPKAGIEWPTIEKEIAEIDGFMYFQSSNDSSNDVMRGFFIKQGPVAYPVDFDLLRDYYTTHISKTGSYKNRPYHARTPKNSGERFIQFLESCNRRTYTYGRFNNYGAYMDMPIGTVEVTASREGISYTQETMHNICVALDNVRDKMFDSIKHKLDDAFATSKGEFYKLYKDLPEFMVSFIPRESFNLKYSPFYIDRNNSLTLKLPRKFKELEVSNYSCINGKPKKESHYSWSNSKSANGTPDYENSPFALNVLNRILGNNPVYYKDENYAFATRTCDDAGDRKFAIIDLPKDKYNSFIKFLDGAAGDITKISSLPMPPRNIKSTGRSITGGKSRSWFWLNSQIFNNSSLTNTLYSYGCDQEFEETVEDYNGKSLVCFNTHNNKISDTGLPFEILHLIFNYVTFKKSNDYACIGIAEKDMKRALKKNPNNFVSVKNYFETHKSEIIKSVQSNINDTIAERYEERMSLHLNTNRMFNILEHIKITQDVTLVGLDDVFVSKTEYEKNNSGGDKLSFLGSMHPNTLKDAMAYLGMHDVWNLQQNTQHILNYGTSMEQVEKELMDLNIPIVSMVENHKRIVKMFKNPANRKTFLNLFVEDKIGNSCKVYDHFDFGTILIDPIKIAKEIIGEIT